MTESKSWASLREALVETALDRGSSIHIVRIENIVGEGVFDTNLCFNGKEIWLEGKYLALLPARPGTLVKIGLRDSQRAFAIKRFYAGATTYVWTRVGHNRSTIKKDEKGWYFIELDSLDKIERVSRGMPLMEFTLLRQPSARLLATHILEIIGDR